MPNTPLPSLFGRFTEILSDHADIGVTLQRLEGLCAALEVEGRAPPLEGALELIVRFRADLVQHFEAEESDAYFGTMARDRPGTTHRILELRNEHAAMLRALGALQALAAEARWKEVPSPARRFIAGLRAHEAAESSLLQEFFLRDEGTTED